MQVSDLSLIEKRINEIDEKVKSLLEENIKDVKELNTLLSELELTKESLMKSLKDKILSLLPELKKREDNSARIKRIDGYYQILGNIEGINKFYDLNTLIYVLEDPNNLNEFNNTLKSVINLFSEYEIKLTSDNFDISLQTKNYMIKFYDSMDKDNFLVVMKDEFDKLYWSSHDLLKDIVLNIRLILFNNVDAILNVLSKKKDEYVKDNNIDETKINSEYNDLVIKELISIMIDPESIMFRIKNNEIDIDNLSMESDGYKSAVETFMPIEKYDTCDKDDFYTNISCLKGNLTEYKYYEKYKYLIDTIADIASKKDEYKTVYTTKKTNIKKLVSDKDKVSSSLNKLISEKKKLENSHPIFLNEKSKAKKIDKLNIKIDEAKVALDKSIMSIREEYNEFDLSLFREISSTSINKGYTILDDFKLFKNNVFVLNDCIKKNELNLTQTEIKGLYDKFHKFIMLPNIQIINTFDFNKEEDVPSTIVNKYKLIDINFELSIDNVDDLIKSCNTIIDSYNSRTALLDADIIKIVDKYYIKHNEEGA